jgi:hypothetical protein
MCMDDGSVINAFVSRGLSKTMIAGLGAEL